MQDPGTGCGVGLDHVKRRTDTRVGWIEPSGFDHMAKAHQELGYQELGHQEFGHQEFDDVLASSGAVDQDFNGEDASW